MITNNLGFCLIRKDLFNKGDLVFIDEKFDLKDISIGQINDYLPEKVLSVQSLFYGTDVTGSSLVKSQNEFITLCDIFQNICNKIQLKGMKSIIFGSPNLRQNKIISDNDLNERLNILYRISLENNLKLYFEALPSHMSDIFNSHEELIKLNKGKIHFDLATWIDNKRDMNEFKLLLPHIDRFHLSIPGYGTDFWNYKESKIISKLLLDKDIKGTIEIQSINKKENAIKEVYNFFTKE
ncbi:hypothetical protein N9C07_05605 [Flavobacteriaceae bacterium]|nr:hypothetical protein [Flavobacteriaceae bacterium]MDC1542173.1 hypothetical protein [Flavobacteriaceae bacterium]